MEIMPGPDNLASEILGCYDTPAYVRRGIQLSEARARVDRHCQAAREERSRGVRSQWKALRRLVSDCCQLDPYLDSPRDRQALRELDALLGPIAPPTPAFALPGSRRVELRMLIASLERFNRRWSEFIETIDLGEVNRQVADYNRYYLLEKECAMRSVRLAARGFVPARPVTREELLARYPLLPVPRLRGRSARPPYGTV